MQTRRLGRTEHHSSLAILGGIVFHFVDEERAHELLHRALDAGVNHLDIAPGYFSAEETVGPHLPAVRDRLFISEKSGKTTYDGVRRNLERTLTRLQVDSVDLYQLHGVTDLDDLDARADAARALHDAREEGLCRWLGITGHNVTTPVAQREALRRYDFDTVLEDGTTVVRNAGVFVYGMISCTLPPIALRKIAATGGGSGLPVAWLGATKGTSCLATPKLVHRKPSGSRISAARISRMSLPVAA